MATAFAGKNGAVYLPGTPSTAIGSIRDFSLQIDAENYESTALGDQWKTFVIGLRGWSGKMSGFFNVPGDPNGQLLVQNALINGTSLVCQFEIPIGTGGATAMYEGTVDVTQLAYNDVVNNLVTFDATFVGNGSLQYIP